MLFTVAAAINIPTSRFLFSLQTSMEFSKYNRILLNLLQKGRTSLNSKKVQINLIYVTASLLNIINEIYGKHGLSHDGLCLFQY